MLSWFEVAVVLQLLMEPSQTCGIMYLAGWHALFPAPLSASSFPYHGRTHDFESLEPAACDVEKGGLAHMVFLHYITRFPQTSFEDKIVWFSFLNGTFINI